MKTISFIRVLQQECTIEVEDSEYAILTSGTVDDNTLGLRSQLAERANQQGYSEPEFVSAHALDEEDEDLWDW